MMYFRWLTFEVINDINKKNEIKHRQDMKELEERIENKNRLVRDELKKEIQMLSENKQEEYLFQMNDIFTQGQFCSPICLLFHS